MSISIKALSKKYIEGYSEALVRCCEETKYLTGRPVFDSVEDAFYDVESRLLDTSHEVFLIIRDEDQKIIGEIVLSQIDHILRQGYFSIAMFCQNNFNKGYGTIALDYLLDYAFNKEDFHRIETRLFTTNQKGVGHLQSRGFVHEGTLRQAGYVEGEYRDLMILGILKADYENKK